MLAAEQLVADAWSAGWEPPPSMTVSQWSDERRMLSSASSAERGPWRTERTPYLREMMDCLSATSQVEEVVFMKGAQIGGTESGLNWLGYVIDVEPAPFMMVQPTTNTAKRFSKQRIAPMIADTPVLADKVQESRARDSGNTTLMKEFDGGIVVIAGANSAADLRSMPVRYLFLDEIDAYPSDVDEEGDPVALAIKRTSTFARRKVFKCSTPTLKDWSKIEAAYIASDRRRYQVPCPDCGHYQTLRWSNVRWPKDQPEAAHYVCEDCGVEIAEHHKNNMLARGLWVAEAPGAAGGKVAGFHLSSLYSPLGWESWGNLAKQFIAAKAKADAGDTALLKAFVNTALAETWEDVGERVEVGELQQRAEPYTLRTVPMPGLRLTGAVDVQGNRLEVKVKAWGPGEQSWVVDYQVFHGEPRDLLIGADKRLLDWIKAPLQHASGKPMYLTAVAIDSGGHHTQEVYAFTRNHGLVPLGSEAGDHVVHVIAIKGASQAGKPVLGKPSDVDVTWRGSKLKHGARVWPVGSDTAKGVIYARMRITEDGPGRMHFSHELPADYYDQLTAERLVTKYHRGRAKLEWVKASARRNEALDLEVYCLAAAHYAGIPLLTESAWARIARAWVPDLFTGADAAPPPGPDTPGADAALAPTPTAAVQTHAPSQPQPLRRPGFVNRWRH
jgi:phage terminase large subunit GpA-like protein